MEPEHSNDGNWTSDDGSWVSITQWLPVSETFNEYYIADWMSADEQEEIADDMIADKVENCEQGNNDDQNDDHLKKMRHSECLIEKNC